MNGDRIISFPGGDLVLHYSSSFGGSFHITSVNKGYTVLSCDSLEHIPEPFVFALKEVILAFFQSPAWQKVVENSPRLLSETLFAAPPHLLERRSAEKVSITIEADLERFLI